MTTIDIAAEAGHEEVHPRQRSARNDAAMRDGDGSHGDPYEGHAGIYSTDEDIGDAVPDEEYLAEIPRPRRPYAEGN